jgi:hypothetical protein
MSSWTMSAAAAAVNALVVLPVYHRVSGVASTSGNLA